MVVLAYIHTRSVWGFLLCASSLTFVVVGVLFFFFFIYLFIFIYSHLHTLFGSFLHPAPLPHSASLLPQFHADPVLPLSLILLNKWLKHNKEEKAFLLVELRIAIQRDSYYYFCVPMCYNLYWFNSNSMIFTLVPDPLLMITSVILSFLY
jgi:hypothetical protein